MVAWKTACLRSNSAATALVRACISFHLCDLCFYIFNHFCYHTQVWKGLLCNTCCCSGNMFLAAKSTYQWVQLSNPTQSWLWSGSGGELVTFEDQYNSISHKREKNEYTFSFISALSAAFGYTYVSLCKLRKGTVLRHRRRKTFCNSCLRLQLRHLNNFDKMYGYHAGKGSGTQPVPVWVCPLYHTCLKLLLLVGCNQWGPLGRRLLSVSSWFDERWQIRLESW